MTTHDEPRLQQALHDLATTPAPSDLGGRALRRARRARTGRAAAVGVLTLAGLLAIPFLTIPGTSGGAQTAAPGTGAPAAEACTHAPSVAKDVKRVDPGSWPEFVRITVAALPPRTDYEMQSGYDLCTPENSTSRSAYAVSNLGPHREHGHLTVNLYQVHDPRHVFVNCAALTAALTPNPPAPGSTLLFCSDATTTSPTVYATAEENQVHVAAVYPDKRAVVIGSLATYNGTSFPAVEITAEALHPVVTSPALAALLA